MDTEAGARPQCGKLDFHQGLCIFSGSCHTSSIITLCIGGHEVRVELQVEIVPGKR